MDFIAFDVFLLVEFYAILRDCVGVCEIFALIEAHSQVEAHRLLDFRFRGI